MAKTASRFITKGALPIVKGRTLASGVYIEPVRPLLRCPDCGEESSADPGDYWQVSPGYIFVCSDCEDDEGAARPLELVRKRIIFEPWNA